MSLGTEVAFILSDSHSASKASADHLVNAWHKTYGLPIIITHTCNNFGPYQHKEKFIPTIISSLKGNKNIPLYGNGKNIREWIYVEDHVKILFKILQKSKKNEKYNIGTNKRLSNIDLTKLIIKIFCKIDKTKKYEDLIKKIKFVNDRLGHDKRYALNSSKIKMFYNLKRPTSFDKGIIKTIKYVINE